MSPVGRELVGVALVVFGVGTILALKYWLLERKSSWSDIFLALGIGGVAFVFVGQGSQLSTIVHAELPESHIRIGVVLVGVGVFLWVLSLATWEWMCDVDSRLLLWIYLLVPYGVAVLGVRFWIGE
jgi:uncharacterized membrane protein YidH (DUF202 family)